MHISIKQLIPILMGLTLAASVMAQQPVVKETLHATVDTRTPLYQPARNLSGNLMSVGTDTMETVMKLWIDDFTRLYPKVRMNLESKGSMTAEPALTAGRAQLAPLSRELMPDELARFKQKFGYEPLVIKVALGSFRTPAKTAALTFYVHESNPITKLTFAQLDAIYCTTRKRGYKQDITTWGQLGARGDWANRPIHLIGVMQPDGVSNNIRITICDDGQFKNNIMEEKIDHTPDAIGVLSRIVIDIAKDSAAIGYGGFHSRQPGTRPIAISTTERGPYLLDTWETVSTAQFPLTRFNYIIVNRPPGQLLDPTVKEFLMYVLSRDGQKAVEKEGIFLPLPARISKAERAKLN
jgi:phosphate transport system substrate-binding protein